MLLPEAFAGCLLLLLQPPSAALESFSLPFLLPGVNVPGLLLCAGTSLAGVAFGAAEVLSWADPDADAGADGFFLPFVVSLLPSAFGELICLILGDLLPVGAAGRII